MLVWARVRRYQIKMILQDILMWAAMLKRPIISNKKCHPAADRRKMNIFQMQHYINKRYLFNKATIILLPSGRNLREIEDGKK